MCHESSVFGVNQLSLRPLTARLRQMQPRQEKLKGALKMLQKRLEGKALKIMIDWQSGLNIGVGAFAPDARNDLLMMQLGIL